MDETQTMLAALNASFPDIAGMDPLAARAAVDARIPPAQNLDDVAAAEDALVPSEHGGIPVRIYRPHVPSPSAPATVYAHGGGFLHGSIAGHDRFCRLWAAGTGSSVVSVEYRLAPEHLAPAPVADVVAVAHWLADRGEAARGLVLAGDSAGANLAAAAALTLRDRGSELVAGQVLIYPMLDPRMQSESYRLRAEGYFVTARALRFYWETYLGGPAAEAAPDWRFMPQTAEDLSSLPPSITVTAGLDPLGDEGRDYAALLRGAGNTALHRHYPDQFHGFLTMPGYGPGASARSILWADFTRLFAGKNTDTREHTA
ncbi:alpha/beta hydrolase [Arthrobacter sp. 08Y14]|uniref:alpha/beta hydrolase n=1 Tax=Arthrobacter sp. 08Y14 TaxID=2058885 RepID=UPI000CE350EA|nr:alpha/beta hydrolase [Arthrobacter sp. 08Y14]